MTKFNCKIVDLETVCNLVSMKGKNIEGKDYRAILDCIFNLTDGKLVVGAMDIQGTFAVQVQYPLEVAEDGQIPIVDLENFEKFLSRFNPSDVVEVSTEANRIVISRESPKKVARFPLAAYESISSKSAPPLEKLEWNDGFPVGGKTSYDLELIVNAEQIEAIYEDGNVISQRFIPFAVEEGKVSVTVKDDTLGEFETEFTPKSLKLAPVAKEPAKTSALFGNGFDNIFANFNGEVKVYLQNHVEACPLIVLKETEQYKAIAILAPYVTQK